MNFEKTGKEWLVQYLEPLKVNERDSWIILDMFHLFYHFFIFHGESSTQCWEYINLPHINNPVSKQRSSVPQWIAKLPTPQAP